MGRHRWGVKEKKTTNVILKWWRISSKNTQCIFYIKHSSYFFLLSNCLKYLGKTTYTDLSLLTQGNFQQGFSVLNEARCPFPEDERDWESFFSLLGRANSQRSQLYLLTSASPLFPTWWPHCDAWKVKESGKELCLFLLILLEEMGGQKEHKLLSSN